MSSKSIICRVCALYPYVSKDPSSLSFEEGAVIDVLAQLDTGWWDGWYNGKRGWFPSNYVQVLESSQQPALPDPSPPQGLDKSDFALRQLDDGSVHTLRKQRSLQSNLSNPEAFGTSGSQRSYTSEQPPSLSSKASNWVMQTTEDGSDVYYYNAVTGEMRYSAPVDDASIALSEEPMQPSDLDLLPTSPASLGYGSVDYRYNNADFMGRQKPSRPPRSGQRGDQFQRSFDVDSIKSGSTNTTFTTGMPSYYHNRHMMEGQLPPDWVRKTTPNGREYYCNLLTEQTTWDLKDIDPHTGILLTPSSPQASYRDGMASSIPTVNTENTLSWNQLSTTIAFAIQQIKDPSRHGQIGLYKEDALLVVRQVHLLLHSSNTVDKENSLYLQQNPQLKAQHHALMAALAKLVLSAKVASGSWPQEDVITKLRLDADEVLLAVRHFMITVQEMHIDVRDGRQGLMKDPSAPMYWKESNSILNENQPDPDAPLSALANNVYGTVATFTSALHLPLKKSDSASLINQFRNVSNATSQFLNAIQDWPITNSSQAARYTTAKRQLYQALGTLLVTTQVITEQNVSTEQAEQLVDTVRSTMDIIDNGVQELCVLGKQYAPNGGGYNEKTQFGTSNALSSDIHLDSLEDHDDLAGQSGVDVSPTKRQPRGRLAKFFSQDSLATSQQRDTLIGTPIVTTKDLSFPPQSSQVDSGRFDFLGPDYNANEIVFNVEGGVKGGTLTALVQRLTQHDQLDSKFNATFLLTYRSFCTTEELFDALFKRYTLAPPRELTPEELEIWKEKKLKIIRLRVFNVAKSWLEHSYNDEEDLPMLPKLMDFTENVIRESMQFGAEQLIKLIRKRMDAGPSQLRKMTATVRVSEMPAPILAKNMKRLRFLDIDPLEMARQLTIMDSRLYARIKPFECLDKNWGKGDSDHIAANIKASIEYSNQVTAWVTDSILSKDEVKKRAVVLRHWILVAERCRLLNNFNTCMAILSAFDNSAIGRIKRTWELVSVRTINTLSGIRRLMGANKNFTEYRDIIHKVNPPCIPFLGIYLQDLTFIEDGNSNFLKKSNRLINFSKRMKTAEVIRELQQYQSTPYPLQAVPDIQEFIKTHLQSSRDEETLYNLSLKLEPRERAEDTIARRLKESGL